MAGPRDMNSPGGKKRRSPPQTAQRSLFIFAGV
uniref:Uncharacterized protein n=1 Tax=Anguilla anguilla TaxID=7936 RepID=A0A0E9VCS3_ANGAN